LFALAGTLAAGCMSDRLASPSSEEGGTLASNAYQMPALNASGLRVMQYNLYLGTDFTPIFQATNDVDLATAVNLAWTELQQTDFPGRAGKIADQIAKVRPDLLAIEEVSLWSVSPDYTYGGPPTSPFEVQYDFLQRLLDALAVRGLSYSAPAVDVTSDVTVPVFTGANGDGVPTGFLVHYQDRDAVLVRSGVSYSDPQHGVYDAAVGPLPVGGQDVYIRNGWSSVRATKGGRTVRFLATHLNAESPVANYGQAQELLGVVANETDPVVLAGDFNTGPGVTAPFAPTYDLFTAAGFTDLWPAVHPKDPGLTNGPDDGVGYLDDQGALIPWPSLVFTTRVDLVLFRDGARGATGIHANRYGFEPGDRTASGLWPSDHAAVGIVFQLPAHTGGR
jgi:hypothetical protein